MAGPLLSGLPKVMDPLPGGKSLINAVDYIVNWARANSLWPLVYGTSCCAIEMMATGAARHDIARFGAEVFRASPRQADLIILAGTLTEKMSKHLLILYEQMPNPKYVIAMGACTISGGPFYYDNYSVVKGADRVVPVDVFVPGCPPRPEALLYGLLQLQELIKQESIRNPRVAPPLNTSPIDNPHKLASDGWKEDDKDKQAELEPQREAWKEANPDYKPYKHVKIDKPVHPAVDRNKRQRVGLAPSAIWQAVHDRFPDLRLWQQDEVTEESLAALDADSEYLPDFLVPVDSYLAVVNFLKCQDELACDLLLQVTAVDFKDHLDVLVHLLSTKHKHKLAVRCRLNREEPCLPTLAQIYPAANWHERETAEMFGVVFSGHPDPRPLLLWDDFPGHPLRKDFSDPSRVVERPY